MGGLGGLDIGVDDVCDVGKVTRMLAVAEYHGLLAGHQGIDKTRDHAGIHRGRILARAENVKVTKRKSFEAVDAVKGTQIMLTREFGNGIGRQRIGPHRFDLGQRRLIAVSRA